MKTWRYEKPNEDKYYGGWFIAFIDSAGCLAVLSDYGDYSHRWSWSKEDRDIRAFLTNCDTGYIADKLGYNVKAEIDGETTEKAIKADILECRRDERFDKDEAREEWENASHGFDTDVDFHVWMEGTKIDEAYEFYRSKKPRLAAFMKQVWPRLIECIRAELESEKQVEVSI